MGDWLGRTTGGSEAQALVMLMLMLVSAILGAFMSSTAVVAIFIPIVLRLCQGAGTSPRTLMMPLSVAALLSGMLTLIATAPNLMVNAELARQGLEGLGFFVITPLGLPLLALAIPYMLFARRYLVAAPTSGIARPEPHRARLQVGEASPIAGRRLGELQLRAKGLNILAIERARRFGTDLIPPTSQVVLQPGDVLLADLQARGVDQAEPFGRNGLEVLPLGEASRYFIDRAQEVGVVEALVPAAIGLRHGQKPAGPHLLDQKLAVGDTLLLFGFWSDLKKLQRDGTDLILLNLPAEFDEVLPAPGRAMEAVLCLVITVGLMVSGVVANVHAALIGCLLLGLFRCVDLPSAYRAIIWKTLVLIVGMLPFSIALQRTGGVDLAANALLTAAGGHSPRVVLALLGLFISNTATAVLMAPVALAVASDLGFSPYPFAMVVALAASSAFMTPVSSPVITLVVAPGNYTFGDFVKVGVPFTLVAMVVGVLLVPWLLPLR